MPGSSCADPGTIELVREVTSVEGTLLYRNKKWSASKNHTHS